MSYAFLLGRNAELSTAEVLAVYPTAAILAKSRTFLVLDLPQLDCAAALRRLGGTVKIAEVVGTEVSAEVIARALLASREAGSAEHIRFGVSFYESRPSKIGFTVKTLLKEQGCSVRLVTSRDSALSSVIVQKERVDEFVVLENRWLARTRAVQEFEEYGSRDYGRPARDARSGMLPPKLAKMMINLSQAPQTAQLLDPFCGSGTVLQEAVLLGFAQIIGTDASAKAIADSKENLAWLLERHPGVQPDVLVKQADVRDVGSVVKHADVIVTEPYLGPPLRGNEPTTYIDRIIAELSTLYLDAFRQFGKILPTRGRVVIIFPWFAKVKRTLPIIETLERAGWKRLSSPALMFARSDQHVWRQVVVLERG